MADFIADVERLGWEMPSAIVRISDWARTKAELAEFARRADAGEDLPAADYQLGFASPEQLFDALTPARLALLDTLEKLGPIPTGELAARLGRPTDPGPRGIGKDLDVLVELGPVERDPDRRVRVPWDEIQIRLALAGARAA